MDMLKQVGFLGATLAAFMLIYQIGGEVLADVFGLYEKPEPKKWFFGCLIAGVVVGGIFGAITKSLGKPLFFFLCLLMIPVATAELSTDNWIKQLMTPVMEGDLGINANWAIVFSAGVMLILRLFAGSVLQIASPPVIMAVSGILSAVGQTYYWPCILGFVAERFPKGGALTLNTVSAMGLLSLGMIGNPILGVSQDKSVHKQSQEQAPEFTELAEGPSGFLWMTNNVIKQDKFAHYGAKQIAGKGEALEAAITPVINANDELKTQLADLKKQITDATQAEGYDKYLEELDKHKIDISDVNAVKVYDLAKSFSSENEEFSESLEASIPAEAKAGLTTYAEKTGLLGEMKTKSGRDVLKFAAIFPGILVLAFGCIAIYFMTRGGYKPIELSEDSSH